MYNSDQKLKPIALFLPQFHPIPENDEWWGRGFTEWSNVVKARPRFRGHYQPHLPRDLGFYDLRLPEVRAAQAALARKFGIHGFCYYHYWFNGRRLLERPVDEILSSGKPDFPFMLCWANEDWGRNWDGRFDRTLLQQKYSEEDFILHAQHLVRYFKDPRYIKIDGKPVFAIYKELDIPNLESCIMAFRRELLKNDFDVFLCRFEHGVGSSLDFEKSFTIFDAGIEFQPPTRQFRKMQGYNDNPILKCFSPKKYSQWLKRHLYAGNIFQYKDLVENDLSCDFQQGWPIFPGVCPGWDNTARRRDSIAFIIDGSTPELFKYWVENKIKRTDWSLIPDSFIFVNAWNEWAEGNHLEPCEHWGKQYLEALQEGVSCALSLPSQ